MTDFAIFIPTYKRPHAQKTVASLRSHGYTGPIYLIVGTDDPTLPEYKEEHGDMVLTFEKDEVAPDIDKGDNFPERDTIIYAREAMWNLADDLGLDYYMVMDDDYTYFSYRIDEAGHFSEESIRVENMDRVLSIMLDYAEAAPIDNLAMAQGGDYLGGADSSSAAVTTKRKAMNSHLLSTDRYFDFPGRLNDDVTAYVLHGHHGRLFFTFMPIMLNQPSMQEEEGGSKDVYDRFGTYIKSFYTIMYAPSCVSLALMGDVHPRIHHRVSWRHAVPKIVSESYRKSE